MSVILKRVDGSLIGGYNGTFKEAMLFYSGSLQGLDAKDQDISHLILKKEDFTGACFDGANISYSNFEGSTFDGVSAKKTKFKRVKMRAIKARGIVLDDASILYSHGTDGIFENASLNNTNIKGGDFHSSTWDGSIGKNARFDDVDLTQTTWCGTILNNPSFQRSVFLNPEKTRIGNRLPYDPTLGAKITGGRWMGTDIPKNYKEFVNASNASSMVESIPIRLLAWQIPIPEGATDLIENALNFGPAVDVGATKAIGMAKTNLMVRLTPKFIRRAVNWLGEKVGLQEKIQDSIGYVKNVSGGVFTDSVSAKAGRTLEKENVSMINLQTTIGTMIDVSNSNNTKQINDTFAYAKSGLLLQNMVAFLNPYLSNTDAPVAIRFNKMEITAAWRNAQDKTTKILYYKFGEDLPYKRTNMDKTDSLPFDNDPTLSEVLNKFQTMSNILPTFDSTPFVIKNLKMPWVEESTKILSSSIHSIEEKVKCMSGTLYLLADQYARIGNSQKIKSTKHLAGEFEKLSELDDHDLMKKTILWEKANKVFSDKVNLDSEEFRKLSEAVKLNVPPQKEIIPKSKTVPTKKRNLSRDEIFMRI